MHKSLQALTKLLVTFRNVVNEIKRTLCYVTCKKNIDFTNVNV